jgi:probable HAF family extracellular repeat protein
MTKAWTTLLLFFAMAAMAHSQDKSIIADRNEAVVRGAWSEMKKMGGLNAVNIYCQRQAGLCVEVWMWDAPATGKCKEICGRVLESSSDSLRVLSWTSTTIVAEDAGSCLSLARTLVIHFVEDAVAPIGSQCANHAFIWTNGKFKDLGVPPKCSSSVGSAISNNGAVGGWCFTARGEQFAFLWTQKVGMRNLGTLPHGSKSTGLGVNDLDEVVGQGDCGTCRLGSHAFVWSPSGGMQDLNNLISSNSGWTLTIASAINNLGQPKGGCVQPRRKQSSTHHDLQPL